MLPPYIANIIDNSVITQRRKYKNVNTSRLVWDFYNPDNLCIKGDVIHHVDGNSLNDDILNLTKLSKKEHMSLHQSGVKNNMHGRQGTRLGIPWTDEMKQKSSATQKGRPITEKQRERLLLMSVKRQQMVVSKETKKRMSVAAYKGWEKRRNHHTKLEG